LPYGKSPIGYSPIARTALNRRGGLWAFFGMAPSPSLPHVAFFLAFLFSGMDAPAQEARRVRDYAGQVNATLKERDLTMRLSLARGASFMDLGFETQGEGRELKACLSLGSGEEGEAQLIAGRGSASGAARFLIDPFSPSALAPGPPVALDSSLESKTNVAGLSAGPLSLFAFRGAGSDSKGIEEAAAGLSCDLSLPQGSLRAIGSAFFEGRQAEPEGWLPDPGASPVAAAADRERPCLSGALIGGNRRGSGYTLAALAGSFSRAAGPGLAFRLESGEVLGPLALKAAAAAMAPAFRELSGYRSYRRFEALVEARLALRRASALSASLKTQAEGESLLYTPQWGRGGSLTLLAPLNEGNSSLETGIEGQSPSYGPGSGELSLSLVRQSHEGGSASQAAFSSRARYGASLRWESHVAGLGLDLETQLSGPDGRAALGSELSLTLFDKGSLETPVKVAGGISLDFRPSRDSTLILEARLPENGMAIGLGIDSAKDMSPRFSLRYRAALA